MYNSDDATMQTITIVNSHHITEDQCVAIKHVHVCTCMDEIGHISNFLVANFIVILYRNKGGEGDGEVG